MTAPEEFEDRFDHDPNTTYQEAYDIDDLEQDEESVDAKKQEEFDTESAKQPGKKNHPPASGGCLGGLFKVTVSLGLIAACYFYIFQPNQFTDIQTKITSFIDSATKTTDEPVLSMDGYVPETQEQSQTPSAPATIIPPIELSGAGVLPDFRTAAKLDPALNSYLILADEFDFDKLDSHHEMVEKMIIDWTDKTDPRQIEELTGLPYKKFFNQISASLLSQTVLKKAGLTSTGTDRMIVQTPIQAMALLYPHLKSAMANKTTVRAQLKTIEPVSSFLIYICRDGAECMASWDLLIDMLGAKQYAPVLEKTPERLYVQ